MAEAAGRGLTDSLHRQLAVARDELRNLRKEVAALKHQHRKDVAHLQSLLQECSSGKLPPMPPPPPPEKKPFSFQPIGHVTSCFVEKNGTPRQGSLCPQSFGTLHLETPNAAHLLRGLDQYSHVWLVFIFHRNASPSCTKTTVAPPRLNGRKMGALATRSPHRPNPIGLTLAAIHSVHGDSVELRGLDLVDGTPVLDMKPYIPAYDSPECFASPLPVQVPSWLALPQQPVMAAPSLRVRFTPHATQQLALLPPSSRDQLPSLLDSVLANDPRSSYRRQSCSDQLYFLTLCGAHATVWFDNETGAAEVVRILPQRPSHGTPRPGRVEDDNSG